MLRARADSDTSKNVHTNVAQERRKFRLRAEELRFCSRSSAGLLDGLGRLLLVELANLKHNNISNAAEQDTREFGNNKAKRQRQREHTKQHADEKAIPDKSTHKNNKSRRHSQSADYGQRTQNARKESLPLIPAR